MGIRGLTIRRLSIVLAIIWTIACVWVMLLLPLDGEHIHLACEDNSSAPPRTTLLNLTNFEYIYKPKAEDRCAKTWNKTMLIVVNSARRNFLSRNLVRKSYGSLKYYNAWNFSVIFLLGIGNSCEDPTIEERLKKEVDEFGDIIVGNFVDSYRNLTYKHLMGYKWAVEFCPCTDYYVKADDDNLVHLFHLVDISRSKDDADIYCSPNENLPVSRGNYSVWTSTVEELSRERYPGFCANAVYTTSLPTIKRILAATQRVKFFWIDDAFVTGILREYVNIHESDGVDKPRINIIRTPVLDYRVDKNDLTKTTKQWIGLVLPRERPPYLICSFWRGILLDHDRIEYYDSSCEYAGLYEQL